MGMPGGTVPPGGMPANQQGQAPAMPPQGKQQAAAGGKKVLFVCYSKIGKISTCYFFVVQPYMCECHPTLLLMQHVSIWILRFFKRHTINFSVMSITLISECNYSFNAQYIIVQILIQGSDIDLAIRNKYMNLSIFLSFK